MPVALRKAPEEGSGGLVAQECRSYNEAMEKLRTFAPMTENISLRGELKLEQGQLRLRFELQDPAWALQDALQARSWRSQELVRSQGLWKTTCFEAFWREKGSEAYWELNLSGQGKWNLYRFEGYREPQPPQESGDFTILELNTTPESLDCRIRPNVKLGSLEASLCAVLRTGSGTHYASVKHAGAKPDFHLKNSFCLAVREARP